MFEFGEVAVKHACVRVCVHACVRACLCVCSVVCACMCARACPCVCVQRHLTLSLPSFSVQIKHKMCKNMNSVQQQSEYHHQKALMESFHLNGHTFRFRWIVQDLEVFVV